MSYDADASRLSPSCNRFILEHPTDIYLHKADQIWFIYLITNGLVRAA